MAERKSNYKENTSFSSVVFKDKSPVLEVELNEIQDIVNTKISRIIKSIGQGVISLSEDSITYNKTTKKVVVKNCVVLEESGLTVYVKEASLDVDKTVRCIYFLLNEKLVTGSDVINENGMKTGASRVDNTIIDPRYGVETSNRLVTEFTLLGDLSFPTTKGVVPLGKISEDLNTFNVYEGGINNKVTNQIKDITNTTLSEKWNVGEEITDLGQIDSKRSIKDILTALLGGVKYVFGYFKKTVVVEATLSGWTTTTNASKQEMHVQRINVAGIKAGDTPIVSHSLESSVSDPVLVKERWKAYSCLDKVLVYDGYVELICYRKKPKRNFFLAVKGG